MTAALDLPVRVVRYGHDAPLPEVRRLRAGPLTAVLEAGMLRYVSLGDREVVRGVYAAVRDRNWGTIVPRFTTYDVEDRADSFAVRFTAEHVNDDVDFVWNGRIDGTIDGVITFTFDGTARRTFLRNRIGFCVLHPMEAAGTRVVVEHPDGHEEGTFPEAISPHQPFFDIVAIRQEVAPGVEVEVRFTGDLFEMEDQRNWTDASYKTYCTPLGRPFPVEVAAGTRIEQSVAIRALGDTSRTGTVATSSRTTSARSTNAQPAKVTIGRTQAGIVPPIGLGLASHGHRLTAEEIDRLRRLGPAHLRAVLDLTGTRGEPAWEATLERAAAEAHSLDAALELEVVAGDAGEGLDRLASAIAGRADLPPIVRALVFPVSGTVTTEAVMRRAREVFARAGIAVPLGGGTRSDFVNANRAALPLDAMDVLAYSINPQVHAFDNASLVETLAAQTVTVEHARRLGLPVSVGPITLRQRINAAATSPERDPRPDELPSRVDVRQMSLFGAGWTAGSIHRLVIAGPAALTYYETTGWLGVMERTEGFEAHPAFPSRAGMLFPLYHVFAAIGELRSHAAGEGVALLPVTVEPSLHVAALAMQAGGRVRLIVANLRDGRQRVRLAGLEGARLDVRTLDEEAAARAFSDAGAMQASTSAVDGEDEIELLPYAIAFVDATGPTPASHAGPSQGAPL